jgi:antitoxin HicB
MSDKPKKILSFSVIYEAAPEGGYVAHVPTLPGCHTQGETIEDAEKNIQEAIELYLESLESHGEEIPHERRVLQGTIEIHLPSIT